MHDTEDPWWYKTAMFAIATNSIVSLLIWLLIFAIVIYVVFLVVGMLPFPPNIQRIVTIIIALIGLLLILQRFAII